MGSMPQFSLAPGRALVASKESVFSLTPEGEDMSFMSVSFVYVMPAKLYKVSPCSVYFSVTTWHLRRGAHPAVYAPLHRQVRSYQ